MTTYYKLYHSEPGYLSQMLPRADGTWVKRADYYADFAAARAEIERLTKERDEARAQVSAAYELAEQAKVFMAEEGGFLTRVPLLPETKAAIRALTPADAQAALEAYGREKVREGMQRAAEVARECWNDPPCEADAEYIPNAILADMEKLK